MTFLMALAKKGGVCVIATLVDEFHPSGGYSGCVSLQCDDVVVEPC